ncbi:MAG: hypothetical protein GY714_16400 [Desulfobacterales bacterium]|nr:hypothetical protein [Desulfobacterales bacterium]
MIRNVLSPLFSGVGGSLVLGIFCSTFMITDKIIAIMPLFIAFNSAITGYRIVENLNSQVGKLHLLTFIFGVAGGALTFAAVNFMIFFVDNTIILNIYDLSKYIVVSGISTYLGAKLAVRYFNDN